MLDESGLPKSFWGECLAALIHVWNRCPTEAVRSATPYELWHGRKPDVSHLRVWGCTAYVHIQKDKRAGLGSHMEKCVCIGYPQGYKGWKFYNPTTKKTVIAERADFDERYFPLSKRPSVPSIAPLVQQLRILLLQLHQHVLGYCLPLLSLLACPTTSHHTLMTLILMMSRVLMSLWIMGGRLVLQHFLQSFL
jgi:hypothetical protein